jgi:guanylate kinase
MLIIFTGLSGSGKTVAANFFQGKLIDFHIDYELMSKHITLPKCTTSTTRNPRDKEVDGIDYYFMTREEFLIKLKNDEFIENAEVYNNHYGLEKKEYFKHGNAILVQDPQGARTIKEKLEDVIIIYFDIPIEVSLDRMINKRKDKDQESIEKRMQEVQYFIDFKDECDYIVNGNQDINTMLKEIDKILKDNMNNI